MNSIKEYRIWKIENKEELYKQYRDYLQHTVLNDDDFDDDAIEDFETWCEVEFERLEEENERRENEN